MEKFFPPALLLTLVLETAVLFIALKLLEKDRYYPASSILFSGIFASFATLPYVWFVIPMWIHSKYALYVGEAGAVVVEALFYWQFLRLDIKKALLISTCCNLISYLIGDHLMFVIFSQ
jgi:hypothetical protein